MKRYLAKLIFAVNTKHSGHESEFDEQIRVVESVNLGGAFYKARNIGKREEETFVDAKNEVVSWKFIDVLDVYALEETRDGEQLYSTTHKLNDSDSYIHYIRQKSMEIQVKNLIFV